MNRFPSIDGKDHHIIIFELYKIFHSIILSKVRINIIYNTHK